MSKARFEGMLTVKGPPRRGLRDEKGVGAVLGRAGLCYEHAFRLLVRPDPTSVDVSILSTFLEQSGHRAIVLVHGYPRRQMRETEALPHDPVPPDARYGHAWLELVGSPSVEPLVYDVVMMTLMGQSLYYEAGEIEAGRCWRYGEKEAVTRALQGAQTYGPWQDYTGSEPVFWLASEQGEG